MVQTFREYIGFISNQKILRKLQVRLHYILSRKVKLHSNLKF